MDILFQSRYDALRTTNGLVEGLGRSRQRLVSHGFVGAGLLSLTTMLDIYLVGWFRFSHQLAGGFIGIHCHFGWIQFWDVWLQVKVNSGPRNPSLWKMKWQFSEINLRVKVPSSGQIRSEVFGGAGGGPAAESWLRLDIGDGWVVLVEHFLIKSQLARLVFCWLLYRVRLAVQRWWCGRWDHTWIYLC